MLLQLLVQAPPFEKHWSREMKEFKSRTQINGMLKYYIKIKALEAAWTIKYQSLAGCSAVVKLL